MPDARKINLSELPSVWGGVDLAARLREAVVAAAVHLPLEEVCTSGSPKLEAGVEIADLRLDATGQHTLRGSFAYAFTEETTLGCSDQRYTDIVRGRFQFSYDRQTSLLRVDVPQLKEAEYDPEEF